MIDDVLNEKTNNNIKKTVNNENTFAETPECIKF